MSETDTIQEPVMVFFHGNHGWAVLVRANAEILKVDLIGTQRGGLCENQSQLKLFGVSRLFGSYHRTCGTWLNRREVSRKRI
jgi:hypothetical protein